MVFTTTQFEALTRSVAAALGLAEARIVVVPHPLGGTDPATVEEWADASIDATMSLLLES